MGDVPVFKVIIPKLGTCAVSRPLFFNTTSLMLGFVLVEVLSGQHVSRIAVTQLE